MFNLEYLGVPGIIGDANEENGKGSIFLLVSCHELYYVNTVIKDDLLNLLKESIVV